MLLLIQSTLLNKEKHMIEHFFVQTPVVARLRGGPLGPYLDDLATILHQQGYAPSSIQRCLRTGDLFGRWLHGQDYDVTKIDEAAIQHYVSGLERYRSGHLPKAAQGLKHVVELLRQRGIMIDRQPPAPVNQWLVEYDTHLEQVAGLALSTRQSYGRMVRRFITSCFGAERPDWQAVTAPMITAFVTREAARCRGYGRKTPSVAVRSFLRFLVFRGEIRPGLEAAAPTPPQWKHASLPPRLTSEEVERVVAVYPDDTATSRRNRAMILFLARLGLRAQEVVALCLDDIDWYASRLCIRPGKTHQARHLPLTQEVGHALAAYLQNGRPQSDSRRVFLQCRPPFRPCTVNGTIRWMVRQAFQSAGIAIRPRTGSHMLRHSAASRMLNRGASFKEVADVLGHRSLQTTGIYAKLELDALAAVALPWLGGAQ
jgi:site-specific recombinase XerD